MKSAYTNIIFLVGIFLLWSLTPLTAHAEMQIEPASQESWTCVDYSTHYKQENPDWNIMTISNHQLFKGISHMVNYKLLGTNGTITIHDGLYDVDYTYSGWWNEIGVYYHFWTPDETPVRNYMFLRDNRNYILSNCNISV